jgi:hypothetical protein
MPHPLYLDELINGLVPNPFLVVKDSLRRPIDCLKLFAPTVVSLHSLYCSVSSSPIIRELNVSESSLVLRIRFWTSLPGDL